jgi:hypothetical protein
MSAKAQTPFAGYGDGQELYPSMLVAPGSSRIWMLYSYQRVDYRVGKKDRRKPRSQPLLSFSDDQGENWAEPIYVGSDSGDIGTGVYGLRSFRRRPVFFWAFWDCAPPAWGFFDGSRVRPLRELFPHTKYRTACWHAWDAIETDDERLWFATGLDYQTRAQVFRTFDGSRWSKDVFLHGAFGRPILLSDGRRVFCAAADGGPRKTHGRRIQLYQLSPEAAVRRPILYRPTEGREIFRLYPLPQHRRAKGYFPIFLVEEKAGAKGGDQRLIFLRAELKPISAEDAEKAATPLLTLEQIPEERRQYYRPMANNDPRTEPRTDAPKDRKIVRVGKKWVLVYADDNPGRLLACLLKDGKPGEPVVLAETPGWGRFQCTAIADGPDALEVISAVGKQIVLHRLTGIGNWDRTPPKVTTGQGFTGLESGGLWPSMCRTPGGKLLYVLATSFNIVTLVQQKADSTEGTLYRGLYVGGEAHPLVLVHRGRTMLLVCTREGLFSYVWNKDKWTDRRRISRRQVGPHFSAASDGRRLHVLYSVPAYQGDFGWLRHRSYDGKVWGRATVVDSGGQFRGVSLCSLGDGKLLCLYAIRNRRRGDMPEGVERLERFTHTLLQKAFNGKTWQETSTPVAWPEVRDHRPTRWDPSVVDFTQIRNWQGLIAAIQQQAKAETPSPGRQIWKLAKPAARAAFSRLPTDRKPSRAEHKVVTDILGTAVHGRQFHSAEAWVGIELSAEAKALLARGIDKLEPSALRRLNRLLLDAAYPAYLHPGRTWRQLTGNRGFVVTFAKEQGIYPTLPPAVPAGTRAVPAAWMVPGFACITRYWLPSDRGGLLVTTSIPLPPTAVE